MKRHAYLLLSRITDNTKTLRFLLDSNGYWKCIYFEKEKKFQKKGRIASDSLHICLKTFQSAEEVEATNYLIHKINLTSFWFFHLYVSGVRVKYQTGPVLPQIQSPYSNIDSFLSCQIENFDRIFTR